MSYDESKKYNSHQCKAFGMFLKSGKPGTKSGMFLRT